jgi:2-iminoacetate synthase ThiH
MDARGRKEPDPNSNDAQERADAAWLVEMREAKAEADKLARDEYQEALYLLGVFGFFHGSAGAFIKQYLNQLTSQVDASVLQKSTALTLTVKVSTDKRGLSMSEAILRLQEAGFVDSIEVNERKHLKYIAKLSFELYPSFIVQAADFLKLCKAA